MVKKTKGKKHRGKRTHGKGVMGGRGKGLRGGRGNAGLHKHKFTLTLLKEKEGIHMFGRVGFKRPTGSVMRDATLNVSDLVRLFPGKTEIDLGEAGYTKLLGAGSPGGAVTVTVEAASAQAKAKIEAAGGRVTTSREQPPAPKAKAGPKAGKA